MNPSRRAAETHPRCPGHCPIAPLRLTAFEELMYCEDRPTAPCCVLVQLCWGGRLERDRLDAALARVLPRHPLLLARVQRPGRQLFWQPVPTAQVTVQWSLGEEDFGTIPPIDITTHVGLRVFATYDAREHRTKLLFQAHHACTDGKGLLGLIEEVLAHYQAALGNLQPPPDSPMDPQAFAQRGRFHRTPTNVLAKIPRQLIGLCGVRQFLNRHPIPLLPNPAGGVPPQAAKNRAVCRAGVPSTYPTFVCHELGTAAYRQLRTAAQHRAVTINDCLLSALFTAITKLRQQHGVAAENQDWLRIMVPMNLRAPGDERLPAANLVSLVFIDRQPQQIAQPTTLLESIHDEMHQIKKRSLHMLFIYAIELARWLPGGLQRATRTDNGPITCVLSNLGVFFTQLANCQPGTQHAPALQLGNSPLEQIVLCPPIPRGNCLAIGVGSYQEKLMFGVHYHPEKITHPQVQDLLQLLEDALAELV